MFEDFSRSFVEKLNSWGLLVLKRHKALVHLKQQGFDRDFLTIYHVGQWYKPFSSSLFMNWSWTSCRSSSISKIWATNSFFCPFVPVRYTVTKSSVIGSLFSYCTMSSWRTSPSSSDVWVSCFGSFHFKSFVIQSSTCSLFVLILLLPFEQCWQ